MDWSQAEIDASVDAYIGMLYKERNGQRYNKAEIRRHLIAGDLSSRSHGSIEMRMCNISSVLNGQNKPYIDGYKPLPNVGSNVITMIEESLNRYPSLVPKYFELTANRELLDKKVEEIRKNEPLGLPPTGNERPQSCSSKTMEYQRDPAVKRWVLDKANGICELCLQQSPFRSKTTGNPWYLEVHHVVPLKESGSDTVCNAVALCPNCHTRCHQSIDATDATEILYKQVDRLIHS